MEREIFESDHRAFRDTVRTFVKREVLPHLADWERNGATGREVWLAAGRAGILAPDMDSEYGGGGVTDYRYHVIRNEELARAGTLSPAFNVHSEVVGGYLASLATPEQKQRWLPGFCSGEAINSIAITEPGAGSDIAAIRTTAQADDGAYVLKGQKTFVTHGSLAGRILVLAKDPAGGPGGRPSANLVMVEAGMPGVVVGRPQEKIGLHSLDTVELFFDNVRVPRENLLGRAGLGFLYVFNNLPRERLSIAVSALALAERAYEETVRHCGQREASGGTLVQLQTVRFNLAEMATQLAVARAFTDRCITAHDRDDLSQEDAAMVKWWNTELCKELTDRCLQLHGGYGYTTEFLIGRAFVDSRAQTIYGGTTEIMKEIIGQSMAF
ncbi:acyl-CoA dehydrogenase family protein [Streptomyces sp. NPDC006530]|uniref:acyl-CoA dehydrogenase family protein n=1 Tax=Streptomyces sp. NPDC006530 TaxID=3364750 RepID=UPI0036A14E0E